MKRKLVRIIWIVFVAVFFTGIDPQPAGATSCGPLDVTLIPIVYEAVTGKDPCVHTVIGTGPALQPRITCTPAMLAALPDFRQRGRGTATYRFAGTCTSPDRPGIQMSYQIGGQWTPSEQKGHNASEVVQISGYEQIVPDRMPGGQIFLMKYARCTRDPWLNPVACTNYGATVPDDIRPAWSQVDELQSFPWTANVISPRDKGRLLAEYNKINTIVPGLRTTPQTGARATAVLSTAPTIVAPVANGLVIHRVSKFQIVPPQHFSGSHILVQFTRLEGAVGQLRETFAWQKPTGDLVQGADIPDDIFSKTREGRWSLRARVDAPNPGDFTVDVPFRFTMQNPAFTTKPRASSRLQGR